jgi:hypothetical protein
MAADNDPRPVLRQELSRVFKNQRVIKAFESLFALVPSGLTDQQAQLDALDLISTLAVSQSTEAVAAIDRLTDTLERLACAPQAINTLSSDDIAPRAELGDIKASTVEAALTDTTTSLVTSSVALANGAGAGAGTLLNAPVAGNPTKWVTINDAGITRQIPTW